MPQANDRNCRLATLHSTAAALHEVDALDKSTIGDIDAFCLMPIEQLTGEEIEAIGEKEGISQALFARHLNVGTKLISARERGARRPSGPSLKLLVLVRVKGLDTSA